MFLIKTDQGNNMKKFDLELIVGIFVLAGLLCLAFMSVKLAKKELFSNDGYELYAIFNDAGG
jgi:phospholipid/cholesterol/gamma-HCH transport system substrate-binding protein